MDNITALLANLVNVSTPVKRKRFRVSASRALERAATKTIEFNVTAISVTLWGAECFLNGASDATFHKLNKLSKQGFAIRAHVIGSSFRIKAISRLTDNNSDGVESIYL